jgi:hypothetical protein
MLVILFAEILYRAQYRIRRSLSKAAHCRILYGLAKLNEKLDVAFFALTARNALEYLEHALCAYAAGRALSARFVADKVHEISCGIDHARVLVHNDEAAAAHYRANIL